MRTTLYICGFNFAFFYTCATREQAEIELDAIRANRITAYIVED